MPERLTGYRILILETREEAQFSRLLKDQGADVMQCPMFTINDAPDPAPVEAWIRRFIDQPCDDLVLMTGEGLRRLLKVVRRLDVEAPFLKSLSSARKFARGPKPVRALREVGLEAQVITEKPTPITASRDTVPAPLAATVHRALAKLPADRFASAAELVDALAGRRPAVPDGATTVIGRPGDDVRITSQ